MKLLFLIPLLLLITVTPVFAQLLSDKTGLTQRFDVEAGGQTFEVMTVSNYDVADVEFDKYEKRLTIFINSGLKNNFGEVTIPKTLLAGNFTFFINDVQHNADVKSNEKISFITLNFTGTGKNQLDIFGTSSLVEVEDVEDVSPPNLTPVVDYDYGLIYVVIVVLIIGAIVAVIVFVVKQRMN